MQEVRGGVVVDLRLWEVDPDVRLRLHTDGDPRDRPEDTYLHRVASRRFEGEALRAPVDARAGLDRRVWLERDDGDVIRTDHEGGLLARLPLRVDDADVGVLRFETDV